MTGIGGTGPDLTGGGGGSGDITIPTTYPAGSTSLEVDVPDGPLWTTVADDYPMDLEIGGIKVTATACTGASQSGKRPA